MADYPAHFARSRQLKDGRSVLVRPIRVEDEPALRAFFATLSDEAKHRRFMKSVATLSDKMIEFFTRIDYVKHMAFVCEAQVEGRPQIVGDARYVASTVGRSCEFGVVIADAWHRSGIAGLLMEALLRAAREQGYEAMEGLVLRDNRELRRFARALGFGESLCAGDPTTVKLFKNLRMEPCAATSSPSPAPPATSATR